MMKRTLSVILSIGVLAGCGGERKRTAIGAGAGAAVGAAAGAIIGNQSGRRDKGALIGAAAGAMLGGGFGAYLDKQAKELEQVAETKRTDNGIITTLKNNVLFPTGSADLKGESLANIEQISSIIKKYPEDNVIVVGYTDNVGSDVFNQQLSERRARSVMLAMVNQGVPSGSIQAMGQGESNPVAPNTTEAGRSKNRRVELQITVDPNKAK